MAKTFFIADTHFGHNAIIGYENRPFASAEEMDGKLIDHWNATVAAEDHVWMLGDFAMAPAARVRELTAALNGHKMLVMGNHDRKHPHGWWREAGFELVSPYPVVFEEFLLLSHEPLYINENMPYANIFGHVHGNPEYKDASAHHLCVSCERIGYTPIELGQARELMGRA